MNPFPDRRRLLSAAMTFGAAPLFASLNAFAETWPARTVRVVEPGAPGGGNDTTLRLFAPHLERMLGRQFTVENRPGAGGRLGVEVAVRSAPDGYTLLLGNAGSNGINGAIYRNLPYDLETDLTPISLLVTGPNAMVVNPRIFPVNDVAGLIAAIKAKPPGYYNYASGGIGSSAHLSAELFKQMAGVRLEHIPYKGSGAVGQAVITGDAPLFIGNLINVMPFVGRGEMKLLAVTSMTRWPDLPDIPTLDESGLRGFETIAWNALFGPKGLPRTVVERLVPALQRIGQLPEVVSRVKAMGGQIVCSPPEALEARVRSDLAKWRDLALRGNIRAE